MAQPNTPQRGHQSRAEPESCGRCSAESAGSTTDSLERAGERIVIGWAALLAIKHVVETVQWYHDNVAEAVRRIFDRFRRHRPDVQLRVHGALRPSPALLQQIGREAKPSIAPDRLLLGYLVVSNLGLLALLGALVVAKVLSE